MRAWMVLLAGALAFVVWSALMVFWAGLASPVTERRVSITGKALGSPESRPGDVPLAALELRPVDGGLLLLGELPSAAAAAELLSKAQVMYAPLSVQDGLRVRPESAQSAWLGEALAVLPLPMPGVEQPEWLLSAEGLRIGGVASDSTVRDAVRAQLAQRFPRLPLSDQLQLAAGVGAERMAPTPAAAPTTVAAQSPPPISETVAPDPLPSSPAEPAGAGVAAGSGSTPHPRQAEVDALLKARPVVFASGSARLRRGEGPDWRVLAKLLGDSGVASVSVRGHTDDRGSADGNRRLSARRAEAVRQALIRAGVAAARIRVEGVGAAEPVASNATAAGRRQNRRIELRLEAGAGT